MVVCEIGPQYGVVVSRQLDLFTNSQAWCLLEKFTKALPVAQDMLALAPGMEYIGRVPESLDPPAGPARRAELRQLGGCDR